MGPWPQAPSASQHGLAAMSPKRTKLLEALQRGGSSAATDGPPTKKRKQLKRRDTEEKVDRILTSHFGDFTPVDTDGTTRNGLTLRERLLQECRSRSSDNGRISTATIKQLRTEYMRHEDPMMALEIKDKNEQFNNDLMKALAASEVSNPAKRTKLPLYSYLDTCASLNQKETVVILRTIIGLSPASSVALRKHILEILKCFVRMRIHEKFPQEVHFCRGVFDDTLALTWAAMKAGGMALEQFWDAYGHLTKPLGIHGELTKIFEEEGSFTHVKHEIMQVTAQSSVGAKLFGTAAVMLKVEDFSASVDAELLVLKQNTTITEDIVNKIKDHGMAKPKQTPIVNCTNCMFIKCLCMPMYWLMY